MVQLLLAFWCFCYDLMLLLLDAALKITIVFIKQLTIIFLVFIGILNHLNFVGIIIFVIRTTYLVLNEIERVLQLKVASVLLPII